MQPTGTAGAVARGLSLFLEATQLKTVRTAVAALRIEPAVVEVQGVGSATPRRNRRRPDIPGVADAIPRTVSFVISGVAEARGLSLFLEATQRKTVRTVVAILRSEPGGVEVQEADNGAGHRRRPTVPVVADVTQCPKAFIVSCVAVARGRAERHAKAAACSAKTAGHTQNLPL